MSHKKQIWLILILKTEFVFYPLILSDKKNIFNCLTNETRKWHFLKKYYDCVIDGCFNCLIATLLAENVKFTLSSRNIAEATNILNNLQKFAGLQKSY